MLVLAVRRYLRNQFWSEEKVQLILMQGSSPKRVCSQAASFVTASATWGERLNYRGGP